MKAQSKIFVAASFITALMFIACIDSRENPQERASTAKTKKLNVQIILGSTRQGRTSDKIGRAVKKMLDKNGMIHDVEIIDLRDYNLPFLNDEVAPASREVITDPILKKWSDKILQADAFIIIVPEYNSGYPGVLKNALDSLYKEWNNKPVALIGYSGGPSGASNALAQLRQVILALQMIPVETTIKIPSAWKAFDSKGNMENKNFESELNRMVSDLIKAQK